MTDTSRSARVDIDRGCCRRGGGRLPELAVHLYLCHDRSARAISRELRIGRPQVTGWLVDGGIDLPDRGHGRRRLQQRHPDPPNLGQLLTELYVRQRLNSRQIGQQLGLGERTVRNRLAEHGIARRSRGGRDRVDRWDLPTEQLIDRYVNSNLNADDAARELGVSRHLLLRAAHDHRLTVADPIAPEDERPLLDALYDDPQVCRTLRQHHVPEVRSGGPLADRFPRPLRLTDELLRALYTDCGVSARHVELLTGIPQATIARRLRALHIAIRPAGGRSPFSRRRRQTDRPTEAAFPARGSKFLDVTRSGSERTTPVPETTGNAVDTYPEWERRRWTSR